MKIHLSKILPFIVISLSLNSTVGYSAGKKQFYLLGGGGEPEGRSTMFDAELETMAKFTNSSADWESTISFNGGHTNTEKIIKNKMSKSKAVGPFDQKNYDALIKEMTQKLESGELKNGDQLMIEVNSHGDINRKDEKTHTVALAGGGGVNLDALEKISNLAAEKGVKLAIVDMSCYSGSLLNIKNDKVCFISATSADTYAYGRSGGWFSGIDSFAGSFHDQLKSGQNLEEIFLKASGVGYSPNFPRISTKAGEDVEKFMYDFIAPFLTYNLEKNVSLFYSKDPATFEAQVCSMNQTYNNIDEILSQYNNIVQLSDKIISKESKAFKEALTNYRKAQLEYESVYRAKIEIGKEVKDILEGDYSADINTWFPYEPSTFMTIDETESIKDMEKRIKDNPKLKFVPERLEAAKKRKKIIDEVNVRLSKSSKEKIALARKLSSLDFDTFTLASKVSIEAKKMYSNLYKKVMDNEKSNPCRDFVL